VVFGIGAGLRPGELVALRGNDVTRRGRQVVVNVSGTAARVVPVAARYASQAWELARRAGSGFVFHPGTADRGYKNFVTNFARNLVADPAASRLSVNRARSSFICDHLAAGAALSELLAISGISQAESLARYARHSKAPRPRPFYGPGTNVGGCAEHGRPRPGHPRARQGPGRKDRGLRR
jgi:integrase